MHRIAVLIAEDEPLLAQTIGDLIRAHERLSVAGIASDAEEAIALAARVTPDVAIVDVKMPHGGGPRASRGIRHESPGTKILALSAYDDPSSIREMLAAGASGYLVKGGRAEEIVAAVIATVRGENVVSSSVSSELVREMAEQLAAEEEKAETRHVTAERIRRVLAGEGASIVFQPIVRLRTGAVVGVEALSRFNGAERGPDVWFAEAETCGLRPELEIAMIRKAIAGARELGGDLYLSLNASPATVLSDTLVGELADVPSSRVVIEVTEHAYVDDYVRLGRALSSLREHGVRIAVDDAGAGYASLRHILQLTPDIIKLDVSLTNGVDHDPAVRALASGLISFAQETGAPIVAEGIEDQRQADTLAALGVEYGQGFHLGRPGPLNGHGSGR